MYGFFATISALAEIWSLTAVSLDRLQAINNPLNAQKRTTKSQVLTIQLQSLEHKKEQLICLGLFVENLYSLQANFIIVLVWGASILFATFPLMGWNRFVSEVSLKEY